jgi:quinol monooxygenase YgiN
MALLFAVAVAIPLGAAVARSEERAAYVVSYIEVSPAEKEQAASLFEQLAAASRKEAGSLRFEVLQCVGRQNQFMVLEAWRDAKAHETHAAGAAAAQFHAKLTPLLIAPYDERLHVGMAVDPRAAHAASGAVYAVTHVDYIPPKKDEGIAAIKPIAEPSRAQAGNARFDILQQANRPNHLTLVEIWSDRAALDAHTMSAPIKTFRNTIGPMSGALFDQRLYHALD